MRVRFLIIIILFSNSLFSQSVLFRDYFPLKEGDKRVFRVYIITKGEKRLMQDSLVNICQSKIIDDTPVYYFRRDVFPDDSIFAWGIPMFCYSFYFKNDNLMSFPTMFKSQLTNVGLDSFFLDIPKVVKLGKVYTNLKKEMNQVYVFNGIGNIRIGKMSLRNCLKLTVYDDAKGHRNKRVYWFKKGIGFVKYFEKGENSGIWEIRL